MHRLWLFTAVVVLTLGPSWGRPADAAECGAWNTREFFKLATPVRVRACLAAGTDLKARDKEGATPLHYAAESTATPAVITALVTAGADPTAGDKDGVTPLHVAAGFNENPAVITALVTAGADPRPKLPPPARPPPPRPAPPNLRPAAENLTAAGQ